MKKHNVEFTISIFCLVAYIVFVLSSLTVMGMINMEMKKAIFKHYNVPLEDNK